MKIHYPVIHRGPDSVSEYYWQVLRSWYFDARWYPAPLNVPRLVECGMFGVIIDELEANPSPVEIAEYVDGPCERCGTPTGSLSPKLHGLYETPDGDSYPATAEDILCDGCAELLIDELQSANESSQPMLSELTNRPEAEGGEQA